MKKNLLLLVLMLLPLVASADAVEIDGIYYNLVLKAKIAEVTSNPNKYIGNVVIPETVTYDGTECSVTLIGERAFYDCSGLTSVTIPNSVTSIGSGAFYSCNGLSSVTIPNSVTSIGDIAFRHCSSLTSVTIPNSVTSIGENAFRQCTGLTSVTIGNGLTSIGNYAFRDCSGLTFVHISDIAAWCSIDFKGYDSNPLTCAHQLYINGEEVKDLVIPNSVISIGNYAFAVCSSLTSVTIPNSVTSIGGDAFYGCTSVTSVTIGTSVTTIGHSAFAYCTSLTSVTIPNSVSSIGNSAFSGCSSLTSVTIPNSVTSIGYVAFYNCSSLTSLTLGSGVQTIGSKAFAECKNLSDVYCHAEKVPFTEANAFMDSYIDYSTLHVPTASVNAYKAAEPWKNFKSIIALNGSTPEPQKCATPTISYVNGKLTFDCETDDVEFIYNVVPAPGVSGKGNDVEIKPMFTVSVYATKAGYENSEVATMEISVEGGSGLKGDVNGDGEVGIGDIISITNIMSIRP